MNARRISRPSSSRTGMFCRLGFEEEMRPVAGYGLVVVCMNLACAWVDRGREGCEIGVEKFFKLPVFEYFMDYGMLVGYFFEHVL